MRFFKRLTLLFTIFLVACDYYYAATDYKDYSVLQYVSLHDKLTNGEIPQMQLILMGIVF